MPDVSRLYINGEEHEVNDLKKSTRQARIAALIQEKPMATQEELTEALGKEGINVTQATVCRDVREMNLRKVMVERGKYRYALPEEKKDADHAKMEKTFFSSLLNVEIGGALVVLKTLPGTANALAYVIDSLEWPEVLGTVAGDDTIFVALAGEEEKEFFLKRVQDKRELFK